MVMRARTCSKLVAQTLTPYFDLLEPTSTYFTVGHLFVAPESLASCKLHGCVSVMLRCSAVLHQCSSDARLRVVPCA
jgi:hypothetical protein